jgi:hypothetical protein
VLRTLVVQVSIRRRYGYESHMNSKLAMAAKEALLAASKRLSV